MMTQSQKLWVQYKEKRKECNRIIGRFKQTLRAEPEYKKLIAQIQKLKELLKTAKSQQRKMGAEYESIEVETAKKQTKDAWELYFVESNKEREQQK